MVNKKEFKGYICEITGKPIKDMKLCPDKRQKLRVRIKCDDSCIHCEKEKEHEMYGVAPVWIRCRSI